MTCVILCGVSIVLNFFLIKRVAITVKCGERCDDLTKLYQVKGCVFLKRVISRVLFCEKLRCCIFFFKCCLSLYSVVTCQFV